MTPSARLAILSLLVLPLLACPKRVSEPERNQATAHYGLGVEAMHAGNLQSAMAEYQKAATLDPYYPEPQNGMGILLHNSFKRYDQAEAAYKKALELRKDFSAAKVNLANLYLDRARYAEAITLYDEVLNDILYMTPADAQAGKGWAQYKLGQVEPAIESLKSSVTTNPKFCLGYRNLGFIYDEQGQAENACRAFGDYREACPNMGDAYYREGICVAKQGKTEEAKTAFAGCVAKSQGQLKDDCQRLLEQLQ